MMQGQVAQSGLDPRLARQSLARPLIESEQALALALEAIFASGVHEFEAVAVALRARDVARPSGTTEPWSAALLGRELAAINASLDTAYAKDGLGA